MYQGLYNNKNTCCTRNNNQNDQRLWLPFLAGAAIISAPFWFGAGKNNNNCCPYPGGYYPSPYYPQPYYNQPYPAVTETNYYYY